MALPDMDLHFAWQAWHLWRWAACGGTLGSRLTPLSPRLLAWQAWNLRHRPSLPVAGVALGDIHAASESISLKYDFVTHNFVTHNSFTHKFIQLCHRQSFTHTHNFVTHNSSHTNDRSSTISFVLSSFSVPLQPLFLTVGRN